MRLKLESDFENIEWSYAKTAMRGQDVIPTL